MDTRVTVTVEQLVDFARMAGAHDLISKNDPGESLAVFWALDRPRGSAESCELVTSIVEAYYAGRDAANAYTGQLSERGIAYGRALAGAGAAAGK